MGNSPSGRDAATSDQNAVHPPPSQSGPTSQYHQARRMRDARGVERGRCRKCPHCVEYTPPDQQHGLVMNCIRCNCPPGAHENLATKQARSNQPAPFASTTQYTVPDFSVPQVVPMASAGPDPFNQGSLCSYPGCNQQVEFDLNTGIEFSRCSDHLHTALPDTSAAYYDPYNTGAFNPRDQLYVQDVETPQQYGMCVRELVSGVFCVPSL